MKELLRNFCASGNLLPCPACGHGDGHGGNRFCPDCMNELPRIDGPRCRGCGGHLDGVLELCRKCLREKPRPFLDAAALFDYRREARDMIHKLKNGRCELIRPCAIELAGLLNECRWPVDVVCAVPLHWTREYLRSYNQSQLLAGITAAELGLPCFKLLRRVRRGKAQKTLDSAERHRNLAGAFKALPAARGRIVLLLDDVFTTGATMSSAATALLSGGAAGVYCASICRA